MIEPRRPAANFDKLARPYRWLKYLTFGPALQRCRTHFLPQLTTCRAALVFGDGDGRFLARLLAASPQLHADAVDISPAMLHQLTRNVRAAAPHTESRLHTHQADALTFSPTRTCDLIVTHFFLDCLTQSDLTAFARNLSTHAAPNALWVISDFSIPTGPMRLPARTIVRLLYLGFRILTGLRTTTLPNHAAALTAAGFTQVAQHRSLAGLLTSEIWEYTPSMQLPPQRPKTPPPPDPVPDPEPASPSLPEPDPGVFHHDTHAPTSGPKTSSDQ